MTLGQLVLPLILLGGILLFVAKGFWEGGHPRMGKVVGMASLACWFTVIGSLFLVLLLNLACTDFAWDDACHIRSWVEQFHF